MTTIFNVVETTDESQLNKLINYMNKYNLKSIPRTGAVDVMEVHDNTAHRILKNSKLFARYYINRKCYWKLI